MCFDLCSLNYIAYTGRLEKVSNQIYEIMTTFSPSIPNSINIFETTLISTAIYDSTWYDLCNFIEECSIALLIVNLSALKFLPCTVFHTRIISNYEFRNFLRIMQTYTNSHYFVSDNKRKKITRYSYTISKNCWCNWKHILYAT